MVDEEVRVTLLIDTCDTFTSLHGTQEFGKVFCFVCIIRSVIEPFKDGVCLLRGTDGVSYIYIYMYMECF